jgi:hypothetical protein
MAYYISGPGLQYLDANMPMNQKYLMGNDDYVCRMATQCQPQ